jgi:hypothetical protein
MNQIDRIQAEPVTVKSLDQINFAGSGMWIGFLFSSPLILMGLISGISMVLKGRANSLPLLLTFAIPIPFLILSGRWWATNSLSQSKLRFLLSCFAVGVCIIAAYLAVFFLWMWFGAHLPPKFTSKDLGFTSTAVFLSTAWSFILASTVKWRVRKLLEMTSHQHA